MPEKGCFSGENPMKECAICGSFFFRRLPSGALLAWTRWEKKRACGPRCAATYKWKQRQESEIS